MPYVSQADSYNHGVLDFTADNDRCFFTYFVFMSGTRYFSPGFLPKFGKN